MAMVAAITVAVLRHDDPDQFALAGRGVGAVAAGAETVEQHLAAQRSGEAVGEGGIAGATGLSPYRGFRERFACKPTTAMLLANRKMRRRDASCRHWPAMARPERVLGVEQIFAREPRKD
jgi:hypothetical protein